jgi:phage baseplate assembly protein W
MAVVDPKHSSQYLVDQDEDQSIGLQLPLILDNGKEASSKTTLEAVKNNLLNLCSTEQGERPMQPLLGVALRQYLFEQYDDDMVVNIQNTLMESINYWLPFLMIKNIDVEMSKNETGEGKNTMVITVVFTLKKDPETSESIQVMIK